MLYVRHRQKKISYRQKTALKEKSIAVMKLKIKQPTFLYLFLKRKKISFGGKKTVLDQIFLFSAKKNLDSAKIEIYIFNRLSVKSPVRG